MNKVIHIIDCFKKHLASILLIFFFISEAYGKYVLTTNGELSSVTKILKAVLLMAFLITLLYKKKKVLIGIGLVIILFIIGQYFLPYSFSQDALLTLSKYLFLLLLLFFFEDNLKERNQIVVLFNVFEILLITNSAFIILGFLFNIPFAETYTYGSRFGYNGLFINSTTGSYVCLIAIIHFLLRYKTALFKQKHFYVFLIALLFIGTKVIYLSILLMMVFYFYLYSKIKYKKLILIGLIILAILGFYMGFFVLGLFNEIRQEKGLLSAVFSFRNDALLQDAIPYIKENWSFINYLTGGVHDFTLRSEFGFIDEIFFFGIIGGFLYFYLFYKSFFTFNITKEIIPILICLAGIIFLAGNFFVYATLPIYILILREGFKQNQKGDISI